MAIIRNTNNSENTIHYIGSVAFLCVVSCAIMMLRFLGFKASINFGTGKSSGTNHYVSSQDVSVNGAYRTNRDDLFGSVNYSNPPRRITPSMVKLPARHSGPPIAPSKSTSNLPQTSNEMVNVRKSAPDISQSSNNQPTKAQIKEQKKLEKQQLAERKKQEKLAAKERERDEKIKKERERQMQEAKLMQNKNKPKKRTAPQPEQVQTQRNVSREESSQRPQHSTNTLESSISRSSGPPPYSDVPVLRPKESDISGNSANDTGSWDIITQHRQQMSRQAAVSGNIPKQTQLDLHYNVGSSNSHKATGKDNSDA